MKIKMPKSKQNYTSLESSKKSPEAIKQNAKTCISQPATESCYCCPLHSECHGLVEYVIKDLLDLVLMYESRLAQVERERDAAVADLAVIKFCALCKEDANTREYGSDKCHACINKSEWEWRGVCAENAKEK